MKKENAVNPNIVFANVSKKLKASAWFQKAGWQCAFHDFPEVNPDGVTLHIFKKSWFNNDKQGIHIESYVSYSAAKQKKSHVTIHLLHLKKIPGTATDRKVLAKQFVDEIYESVSNWDGYKFRVGKYGLQPFTKYLNATDDGFEMTLFLDITKMCKSFGPVLDRVLKELMKDAA